MDKNGEKKLIAVARHIAKTLSHTDTMTDDILQIFSNFDDRLQLTEKLIEDDPRTIDQTLKSLHKQISKFVTSDQPIWSDSTEASSFLDAVDELISVNANWAPLATDKNLVGFLDRAEELLQQAMFRLEDEFKTLVEIGAASFDSTNRGGDDSDGDEDEDEFEGDDDIPIAHPIVDFDIVVDSLPSGTINDLQEN